MFRRLLKLGCLTACCILVGCGVDSEGSERSRSALFGGTASGSDDDAVVFIVRPAGGCSAVLVAPNLLLSTSYCTNRGTGAFQGFTCTAQGELVNLGSGAGEIGEESSPEQIKVYTGPVYQGEPAAFGRQIIRTGTTTVCRNDLAFVVLDRSLEGLPILPLRLGRAVRIGELVTAIGYGANEDSAKVAGRRRREGIRVTDLGNPPRTFAVNAALCLGDSGGPALSADTGAIAGVLSLLHDSCGSDFASGTFTELSPFRDFALQAFRAAGADWWLEGEASPSPVGRSDVAAAQPVGGCTVCCSTVGPSAFAHVSMLLALGGLVVSRRARRAIGAERQIQ